MHGQEPEGKQLSDYGTCGLPARKQAVLLEKCLSSVIAERLCLVFIWHSSGSCYAGECCSRLQHAAGI